MLVKYNLRGLILGSADLKTSLWGFVFAGKF